MSKFPIDIIIPWVDSNDPEWRAEKMKYSPENTADDRESRYRDWDTIKYVLRSIDKFMPWVNKVFFVTWGHTPEWLNKECSKLVIVNHRDYIPEKYLPTFSSHAIELNFHRIEGLSENFIYFNDDLLALAPLAEEDFFVDGVPCDYAILNVINTANRGSVQDVALSDVEIINDHFDKNEAMRNNRSKWNSSKYGKDLIRTQMLKRWPYFTGFLSMHQCNAFAKSTFEEVWDKEYDVLDSTCSHKFRTHRDVNQWLMRYWQLASGNFVPIKPYGKLCSIEDDGNEKILQVLNTPSYKTCVINDNVTVTDEAKINKIKEEVTGYLDQVFPDKSSFEL